MQFGSAAGGRSMGLGHLPNGYGWVVNGALKARREGLKAPGRKARRGMEAIRH